MLSESALQTKIIQYLNKKGAWIVKIIACNKKGTPDILVCYKGKFLGLEVKREDGKGITSKLQKYRIKQIKKAGGKAYVVNTLDQVKKIMLQLEHEN